MAALLLWLPLLGSLANFIPLTKYHWLFEFNREIFFIYLVHHLIAIIWLFRGWRSKKLPLFFLVLLLGTYSFAVRLPQFTELAGKGTQVYFSALKPGQLFQSSSSRYDFEIAIGEGALEDSNDQIYLAGAGTFLELSDYKPGVGVRLFKIDTSVGPVTVVVLNIATPHDKHRIYDRKVILRRINSLFRHPPAELVGPVVIVGNFGAGPLTWDFQQFWQEDNFKMFPLDWSAGLGLPSSEHLYFASRGIKGIRLAQAAEGVTIEFPLVDALKSNE